MKRSCCHLPAIADTVLSVRLLFFVRVISYEHMRMSSGQAPIVYISLQPQINRRPMSPVSSFQATVIVLVVETVYDRGLSKSCDVLL